MTEEFLELIGGLFYKGFMEFLTNLYPMNLQKIEIQENMPNKF